MEKFKYKAKDKEGKSVEGLVEAISQEQAAKILREKNLLVITLSKKGESITIQVKKGFGRVTSQDKVNFTRQLSTMINAGLNITKALRILENQSNPALAHLISEVSRSVEGGSNLADALEKYPRVFDRIYISLIRAGEAAGLLDKILLRLADNLEKNTEFRRKVIGAMVYPAIVVGGMFIVVIIMITLVIPKLTSIYEDFQAELPAMTKLLMGVSKFATNYWWLALMMVGGLIFLGKFLLKNPQSRKQLDELTFNLPIIGKLRKALILTEFTRIGGLLIGSGILIVEALNITCSALGSPKYEDKMKEASKAVEKGIPLATALDRTEIFPPILPQMIAVGEETGKLDEVLEKVSVFFEQEADAAVKGLTTAIEPIIMIILGVGVGFLMISIITPIYNLTSQF